MNLASIDWLGVVICVIVNMVIGTLWYNPKTFYPAWRKGQGKPEQMELGTNMPLIWTLTIVASLVIAIALSFVVKAIGSQMSGGVGLGTGAMVGFMLWLGFIAPAYLINSLFAGRSFSVWAIEVGEYLFSFVLMGAILGQLN